MQPQIHTLPVADFSVRDRGCTVSRMLNSVLNFVRGSWISLAPTANLDGITCSGSDLNWQSLSPFRTFHRQVIISLTLELLPIRNLHVDQQSTKRYDPLSLTV